MNKLYKSKTYPLLFQIIALGVFLFLIAGSIGITTNSSALAKQLRNTNLANLIVWSYWWPLIVLTAVFFGRHWCSICPIELISTISTKLGLKKKVPKSIKTGWAITFLYAFVAIIAISTWNIHRFPNRMAYYLLSLMGLAVIVSLVFEKRAFCSYFCPVGKLLGIYSLMSKLGIRVKNQDVCKSCKTKDCISKENQKKLIGRSCTSGLYPANIKDNRDCILCTQCIKVCPNNNIVLNKEKRSFLTMNPNIISWAEVGMISILLGFTCYEILSSWEISKNVILYIPELLHEELSLQFPKGLSKAIILYLAIPAFLLTLYSTIAKLTGKRSLKFYIKRITLYLLPVIAFAHVFKALLKTTSRIPYWKYALEDPNGMQYAKAILDKQIILSKIGWLDTTIIILGIAGLIAAAYYSIKKIKNDKEISHTNQILFIFLVIIHITILTFGPISRFIG